MLVRAIKTRKFLPNQSLDEFLLEHIKKLEEKSILVITSKIVALSQGRLVEISDSFSKKDLIKSQAEYYLDPGESTQGSGEKIDESIQRRGDNPKEIAQGSSDNPDEAQFLYSSIITYHHGILGLSAGVDGSNSFENKLILLPEDPFQEAARIRDFLCKSFKIKSLGVILSDSITRPVRWGVVGVGLSYAGFMGVSDRRGTMDLAKKPLEVTTVSVVDALASSAVLSMGEADESSPLCLINDLPKSVVFTDSNFHSHDLGLSSVFGKEDQFYRLYKNHRWRKKK